MTGIALELKVGAPVTSSGGGEALAPPTAQAGFSAILADLSERGGAEPEARARVGDLLVLLRAIASSDPAEGQASPAPDHRGFLGGCDATGGGFAPPPRDLAAIFNEFGLFGSPVLPGADPITGHQPCGLTLAGKAAPPRPGTPSDNSGPGPRLSNCADQSDAVITGESLGSSPSFGLSQITPADAQASPLPRPVAASAGGPPLPLRPEAPPLAPAVMEAVAEAQESPTGSRAAAQSREANATEPAPRVSLLLAEQGASLVARLDRLSREERLRLRDEAERLLAAFGLAPREIRINGAVDGRS